MMAISETGVFVNRQKFIDANRQFIRGDIPMDEWQFRTSVCFGKKIQVWHIPTKKYKPLFDLKAFDR